ncbi:MAG: DUF2891 domain-containing protein [Planctomycetota bacterium]
MIVRTQQLLRLQVFAVVAGIAVHALLSGSLVFAQEQSDTDQQVEEQDVVLPVIGEAMSTDQVTRFLQQGIDNIQVEYPNKPNNVMGDASGVRSPREMHPAFYGSFDWHSCVHQHWMLIRLIKLYPDTELDTIVRQRISENINAENMAGELSYYLEKEAKSYERMYGWAWYFRLVGELETWDDEQGKQWREDLRPLEDLLVERTMDFLPVLDYPIRTGIHPDTGFALGMTLDYARAVGNSDLEALLVQRARDYYLDDVNYPTMYEPSGQDFFSSCLNEADLMRRVLPPEEFSAWFDSYLPSLKDGDGGNLLKPVRVSDVTDGYIVHLAGLDLSRGWCMQGIASALPEGDSRRQLLEDSMAAHAEMGYGYVFTGHYAGEHWLATFAIYLQTRAGVQD